MDTATPVIHFQKDSIPHPAAGKTRAKDSLGPSIDTLGMDSLHLLNTDSLDSIRHRTDTLGVKVSKDTLDAAVDYKADDSVVMICARGKERTMVEGEAGKRPRRMR